HCERTRTDSIDAGIDFRPYLVGGGRRAAVDALSEAQCRIARALAQRLLDAGRRTIDLSKLDEGPDHDDHDRNRKCHFHGSGTPLVGCKAKVQSHSVLVPAVAEM